MPGKKNIDNLFKDRLGQKSARISHNNWVGLKWKFILKKFLSFNPAHFNVYYLSSLILIGFPVYFLSTSKENPPVNNNQPGTMQVEIDSIHSKSIISREDSIIDKKEENLIDTKEIAQEAKPLVPGIEKKDSTISMDKSMDNNSKIGNLPDSTGENEKQLATPPGTFPGKDTGKKIEEKYKLPGVKPAIDTIEILDTLKVEKKKRKVKRLR